MISGIGLGLVALPAVASTGAGNQLSVTSGSGYAGSVYSATASGQWSADGVAISGAVGSQFTMTAALEGATIRCGNSSAIRMAMPQDFGIVDFDSRIGITLSGTKVTHWAARGGAAEVSQSVVSAQPSYVDGAVVTAAGGAQGFLWPNAPEWLYTVQRRSTQNALRVRQDNSSAGSDLVFFAANTLTSFLEKYTLSGKRTYSAVDGNVAVATASYNLLSGYFGIVGCFDANTLPSSATITDAGTQKSLLFQASSSSTGMVGITRRILLCGDPTLALDNRLTLEGIMAHTYGTVDRLPSDHPYKTATPRVI